MIAAWRERVGFLEECHRGHEVGWVGKWLVDLGADGRGLHIVKSQLIVRNSQITNLKYLLDIWIEREKSVQNFLICLQVLPHFV